MKSICLYFQVHQPWRMKRYRFFNIGADHNYLDDLLNRSTMMRIARECYLPMNALLLNLIKESRGHFKCSFSITGLAIEQFKAYAPEVLDSFRALAKTGCVEFLAETYSHSLSSLISEEEFAQEVKLHAKRVKQEFGVTPTAFRNTELIYSDKIGEMVYKMGYKVMLVEGAKHIMGWQSPNYIYNNPIKNKLRLLVRNYKLSDDIAFRFASNPQSADAFAQTIEEELLKGDVVNLFMDYETFGEHQKASTGIFAFFRALPAAIIRRGIRFETATRAAKGNDVVSQLHVQHAMSWADEERDVTAWLGNELQNEAFTKLYAMRKDVKKLADKNFDHAWQFMKCSDHFYYMATKCSSDGDVHSYFNPYQTPYEAFINYMNVLSDLQIELGKALGGGSPKSKDKERKRCKGCKREQMNEAI